jgi:glutamine---fructose-6-phosphate transaminase (isomerizing)
MVGRFRIPCHIGQIFLWYTWAGRRPSSASAKRGRLFFPELNMGAGSVVWSVADVLRPVVQGYGEPIALEGALKLKEMAYLHAEGYSGGALKHGPFALIEGPDGRFGATPIICLILDDEHASHMRVAAEEVKARGADLIIITDNPRLAKGLVADPIVIPNNGPLTALIATLPLQLIAYELALLRGINPDKPRNLAKAVTTD